MSISELSIRKPVLATVISLLLVIFGAVGFSFLGTREYPAVDPPIITVTTSYPGANPDVIESQITEPLEQAINGIAGVRFISSTSREQVSVISVEFNIDVDLEAAANDVRSKVSEATRNLPQDADPPVVDKADANSQSVVFLSVQSDTRSLLELSDYASNVIKERLQTIPGVSGAYIRGERRYSMRLWMDPVRMSAYRIVPSDIQAALLRENIDLPTGRLEGNETEITLRTDSRLVTPEEYNRMIIKTETGRIVRFSDIGYAELGAVLISALVALTLSPMMCAYLLKHQDKPSAFYRKTEQFYEALTKGYNRSLQAFMRFRWSAVVILLVMFVVIGIVGTNIQSELAPLEDRAIIRVNVKAPEGVSYEYMEQTVYEGN